MKPNLIFCRVFGQFCPKTCFLSYCEECKHNADISKMTPVRDFNDLKMFIYKIFKYIVPKKFEPGVNLCITIFGEHKITKITEEINVQGNEIEGTIVSR